MATEASAVGIGGGVSYLSKFSSIPFSVNNRKSKIFRSYLLSIVKFIFLIQYFKKFAIDTN